MYLQVCELLRVKQKEETTLKQAFSGVAEPNKFVNCGC